MRRSSRFLSLKVVQLSAKILKKEKNLPRLHQRAKLLLKRIKREERRVMIQVRRK